MKRVLAIVLLTSSFALGQAQDKEKVKQELLSIEQERIKAVIGKETETLERILSDDLTYTHSSGVVETKAQFIAAIKAGDLKYEAMDHQDVNVRPYGDLAILTGRSMVKVQSRGQNLNLQLRFMIVYAKQKGRWQMVAWQSTRMAQQQ